MLLLRLPIFRCQNADLLEGSFYKLFKGLLHTARNLAIKRLWIWRSIRQEWFKTLIPQKQMCIISECCRINRNWQRMLFIDGVYSSKSLRWELLVKQNVKFSVPAKYRKLTTLEPQQFRMCKRIHRLFGVPILQRFHIFIKEDWE